MRSMLSRWYRIALFNFLVAALLGLIMRYYFVHEIPGIGFMHILYTHSHVALMGWGFLGLFTLIVSSLADSSLEIHQRFNRGFWIAQLLVLGMLLSFPVQGYGPVSIGISSLMLLTAYYLLFQVWNLARSKVQLPLVPARFLFGAFIWFIISTLGLWSMGPIVMAGWKGHAIYFMSIQFFLHFQINGWFIFAIIGLILFHIHRNGHEVNTKAWNRIFWLLVVATVFTYALAVSWSNPSDLIFAINSTGVIIQLFAMVFLFKEIIAMREAARASMSSWAFRLIGIAFICLFLKVIIQSAVIIPPIAIVAYTIRNFVIGFLHLILLGLLSHFILAEGFRRGYFPEQKMLARIGMVLFFSGFISTELLLFGQGAMVWFRLGFMPYFYEMLFGASLLLPLGIGGLFASSLLKR